MRQHNTQKPHLECGNSNHHIDRQTDPRVLSPRQSNESPKFELQPNEQIKLLETDPNDLKLTQAIVAINSSS